MSFLKEQYDEKAYLQEQLLKIEDTNTRKEAREIINYVLEPFHKEIKEAYDSLEEKLLAKESKEEYQIITAIKPRDKVDITEELLYPMRQQDMEKPNILLEELLECLQQGKTYELYQIFVEDTYEKVLELVETNQKFPVKISTEYGDYTGKAVLEPEDGYEEILLQLYEDFIQNGVEWKTINAPYLHKLFKVMLIEANCPEDEAIQEITVDFGVYKDVIRYDYVPLWNLTKKCVQTSAYPKQSGDSVYFEHTIHKKKLCSGCSYLVHKAEKVWDARLDTKTGDLLITCKEPKPAEWTLWEFTKDKGKGQKEGWMKNANIRKCPYIRTQAEAIKFAQGLPSNEYVTLLSVTTNPSENRKEVKTYQMDGFLPEEIRKQAKAPKLYLECSLKNQEHYLNQDMLSFLASRFQLIYPEYECVVCVKN